jgi:hypothetical protein
MTTAIHHPVWGHEVKLGKAPKRHDARTLQLENYTTAALPAAPSSVQWGYKVPTFPMFANDSLGDCTCAAVGHQAQVWTSMNNALWTPQTSEVTDLYWATGDGSGQDDTGRVEIDVLNYWRNQGFGARKDKIAGYAEVKPLDTKTVKQAVWLFGGLYIGVALPITAQSQSYWKVVSGAGADAEPGSWGGHAINVTAFTSTYVVVVTWGARMKMSWGFWNKYVDEAYAVLSPDWATANAKAPSGFNFAALNSDLASV